MSEGLVKTFSLFIADGKMNLFICLDIEQIVLVYSNCLSSKAFNNV
jgi:hypothetical protein